MPLLAKYLNRFRHIAGKRQAAEIIAKLKLDREQGNIKNLKDLEQKIAELLPQGKDTNIVPISNYLDIKEGDKVDDQILNDTMLTIATDLMSLFEENDNIDEILLGQEKIMRKALIKDLKQSVKRLRAEVEAHEMLARINQSNTQSYANSRVRAWESDFQFAGRKDSRMEELYVDYITGDTLPREYECSIDDGYLVLPLQSKKQYRPLSARLIIDSDDIYGLTNRPASVIDVDVPELGPSNAIDGKQHTYWARSVLLPAEKFADFNDQPEIGVTHKLQIDFSSSISFNYMKFEPILSSEVYIMKIQYLKSGSWYDLYSASDSYDGIQLRDVRTIYFGGVQTDSIRILFESRSPKIVTFLANEDSGDSEPTIKQLLYSNISSTRAKEIIGAIEDQYAGKELVEYFIGIDNIYIGYGEFKDKGIFVSKPKTFNHISSLGIATDWLLPYRGTTSTSIEYTSDLDSTFPPTDREVVGTVEVYLIKWDYSDEDKKELIRRSIIPIVPLFRGRRIYDRLLLTEKEGSGAEYDIGWLRFFASDTTNKLYIYKDGELTTGWTVHAKSNSSINVGKPMKHAIQISDYTKDSSYVAVYEVLRTNIEGKPKFDGSSWGTGSTLIDYNDILGDMTVTIDKYGFYKFDKEVDKKQIKKTEVSYAVIMRNCTKGRYPNVSPILKNCRLIILEEQNSE